VPFPADLHLSYLPEHSFHPTLGILGPCRAFSPAAEALVPLTSIALSSSMKPSTELLSSLLGSQSYQVRAAFTGAAAVLEVID